MKAPSVTAKAPAIQSDAWRKRSHRLQSRIVTGGRKARAKPFPLVRIVAASSNANPIPFNRLGCRIYRAHSNMDQKLNNATGKSAIKVPAYFWTSGISKRKIAASKPATSDSCRSFRTWNRVAAVRADIKHIRTSTAVREVPNANIQIAWIP
jgi:hypothetical protein